MSLVVVDDVWEKMAYAVSFLNALFSMCGVRARGSPSLTRTAQRS